MTTTPTEPSEETDRSTRTRVAEEFILADIFVRMVELNIGGEEPDFLTIFANSYDGLGKDSAFTTKRLDVLNLLISFGLNISDRKPDQLAKVRTNRADDTELGGLFHRKVGPDPATGEPGYSIFATSREGLDHPDAFRVANLWVLRNALYIVDMVQTMRISCTMSEARITNRRFQRMGALFINNRPDF